MLGPKFKFQNWSRRLGVAVCFCNPISGLGEASRALWLTGQPSKLWVSLCEVGGSFGLVYTYAHTKTTAVAIVCDINRRERELEELKSQCESGQLAPEPCVLLFASCKVRLASFDF